jgi:hypothetical protein
MCEWEDERNRKTGRYESAGESRRQCCPVVIRNLVNDAGRYESVAEADGNVAL